MSPPVDPLPFRWNIAKRNELGSLPDGERGALADWISWHLRRSAGKDIVELSGARPVSWFVAELLTATSRILAYGDDGELFFVGRSPENFHDFLSGVFARKTYARRVHLLPFSVGGSRDFEAVMSSVLKRRQLARSLTAAGLAPRTVLSRRHPTALIDIVGSGHTLGCLVTFLRDWCADEGADWRQVRKKLHIIGLTERTKTSPKTWRWQQHAEWTALLPRGAIKNVSIPHSLFHYVGAGQPKTTLSFTPDMWDDPATRRPRRDDDTRMAVRLARALYDLGRRQSVRNSLARRMSAQPAVRHAWFRQLMREVRSR